MSKSFTIEYIVDIISPLNFNWGIISPFGCCFDDMES